MIKVAESPGRHVPTQRQADILQFIGDYLAANGCAPSDRDIATGVGLKSGSSAHYHLRKLRAAGFVGQVAAGEPIPPLESIEARFPLPREMVGAEEGLFILTVAGDSMIGAGIFEGDWIVVRRLYERPKNGDIVAVLLADFEDEGTVKTYWKHDRRVWLMPRNSAYTPIPGDKATIHGKVVAVLRQV